LSEFHEFFKIQSTQDLVPKVFVLYNCLSTVWCPLHLKDHGLVVTTEDHIHTVHSAGCTYVRLVERPGCVRRRREKRRGLFTLIEYGGEEEIKKGGDERGV
jgi:hypothetical protein